MNRCDAAITNFEGTQLGRCSQAARISLDSRSMCLNHAKLHALWLLTKLGKAKEIPKTIAPKPLFVEVEKFVEPNNRDDA